MNARPPDDLYDLLIIGASFAGLTAAKTAAMRGLRVAVIERKSEPGARIHTTGILVKEAADEVDIPAALTRKIRGVRLYAPNLTHTDLFAPGYYFLATDMPGLMRYMAREAIRAGAELLCGNRFEGAERRGRHIHLPGLSLTTRYLIGADGAKSRVAESFGLGRNKKFLVGLEAEYEGLANLDGRFLHCFLDQRIAKGYLAWAVPGVKAAQVGLAVSRAEDADIKPNLKAFEQRVSPLINLENGEIVGRRSGLIPAGGLVHPFSAPGVLLVGDSAGLVSPLTGGGIRLAYHFGRRAAQAVSDYLCDRGPDPGQVMAAEYPTFRLKSVLRGLMDIGPPNWLLNAALSTAPMQALAAHIYFHRRATPGAPYELPEGERPEPVQHPPITTKLLSV